MTGRNLAEVAERLEQAARAQAPAPPAPQPEPRGGGFFDAPEPDPFPTRVLTPVPPSADPVTAGPSPESFFGPLVTAGLPAVAGSLEPTIAIYPPTSEALGLPPGTVIPQWGPEPSPPPPPPDPNAPRQGEFLCRNCREKNRVGDLLCWACGAPFRGAQQGQCPRCDGPLHTLQVEGSRLFACENCGGVEHEPQKLGVLMLQPVDVQDELLGRVARNHTGTPQHRHAVPICSACGPALYSAPMMVSPTPVLTCPLCRKTFLDGGDLEELLLAQRRTRG